MTVRRAAPAAALAVVWGVCVWLLWRTSTVPASLRLPHVPAHTIFTRGQLHSGSTYAAVADVVFWGTIVVKVAALAAFARWGLRWTRESAAGPLGTGMLLGMLGFALAWVVELPFAVLDLWWQRRHDVANVGYAAYLFGHWLQLGSEFTLLCLALAIAMGLARRFPESWWLLAAPIFVGLAALSIFITPYLIPTHRLANPQLRAIATKLERIDGVHHVPVRVEDVRSETSLPNAESVGLGPSRRVILWNTLLDGSYTTGQLKLVIAHELGHVSRRHLLKEVGWFALLAFPVTFVLSIATRRRGGMGRPEAVPLAILALVVVTFIATPLQNLVSRHLEAEADWVALRSTHDPGDMVSLFRAFSDATPDPAPSTWDYVWLENHPTIAQRIAMARAYAASVAQSP